MDARRHVAFFTAFGIFLISGFVKADYGNVTEDGSLWSSLVRNCKRPTLTCIQDSFYKYVDDGIESSDDIDVGGFMRLTRNSVLYDNTMNNTIEEKRSSGKSDDGPLGDIAKSLRNKMIKFMMSHDVQLQLPQTFFDGAIFKISPRSLGEDGALVNLDILPNQVWNPNGEGRIFFKKLKEFIGEKLLTALLAILLVIKLISVKFLFLLPMVMGAAAAKKLLLKLVLFVFPFLTHIFKLCPYVPHGIKFHQHKHLIKHFHHVPPHPHHPHHPHDEGIEIIAPHSDGPPALHHHLDHRLPEPEFSYNPHEDDLQFYSDGPSYTHDFITHRKDANKKAEGENSLLWGSKTTPTKPPSNRPLTPTEIENMVAKAEKEALIKAKLQQEQLKVQAENMRLHEQIKKALKLQEKLKMQSTLLTNKLSPPPAPNLSHPSTLLQTPVQKNVIPATITTTTTMMPTLALYDAFYSPILEKIDKILVGLGFNEEPCRERLICSMYKNPPKFSPHSNLLSAELSRDSSELQKPTSTNLAVIRFYKYVQAARDGQDQRDCLRLYPACSINTEEWK